MGKWKQPGEFTNETQGTPVQETPTPTAPETGDMQVAEEAPAKGGNKKLIIGIVTAVAVVLIVIICVIWQSVVNRRIKETPEVTPSDLIGGDVIGTNPDDLFASMEPIFSYTTEEKEQLRAWGYTGDEIETAQLEETPVSELIAASKQAQEEARAALANPESPEYLALLNQTWLGELAVDVPVYDPDTSAIGNTPLTINADYEKVPAHGTNLFLKVTLEDGTHHFMEVSPYRYSQLPDHGNIVVTYDLLLLDGKQFINNMTEKKVD